MAAKSKAVYKDKYLARYVPIVRPASSHPCDFDCLLVRESTIHGPRSLSQGCSFRYTVLEYGVLVQYTADIM